MNAVTSFNGWLLGKINSFLASKEGCQIEVCNYTNDGARTVVQDAFGFRYEITIRTIGRMQTELPASDLFRYERKANQ